MDIEMSRENIIKLSVAAGLLLIAIVAFFTLNSKPKVKVVEDAPSAEAGGSRAEQMMLKRNK